MYDVPDHRVHASYIKKFTIFRNFIISDKIRRGNFFREEVSVMISFFCYMSGRYNIQIDMYFQYKISNYRTTIACCNLRVIADSNERHVPGIILLV